MKTGPFKETSRWTTVDRKRKGTDVVPPTKLKYTNSLQKRTQLFPRTVPNPGPGTQTEFRCLPQGRVTVSTMNSRIDRVGVGIGRTVFSLDLYKKKKTIHE